MKVLIIEDEAPAFRRLQKTLEELDETIEIVDVIDSVADSVKYLRTHGTPELIFMDIQLSDGISFEIFDQIEIFTPVIFTTAFDEYMLRAFKVNSIDYLLKPIKPEEVSQSLKKFRQIHTNGGRPEISINELINRIKLEDRKFKTRFLIKKGDELLSIETANIAFFRVHHGVVHLHTMEDKVYLMDQTLDEIQHQLSENDFFRANRQFLVHFNAIRKVHRYHKGKLLVESKVKTEHEIVVSSEKSTLFKAWLNQ